MITRAELIRQTTLGLYMTRMEFQRRFAGSRGGAIWMFVGPLATMLAIWVAIGQGLAVRQTIGPGYGVQLAIGLAVWLCFADAAVGGINAISANPHLVKKVVFPVHILPLTLTIAAFTVHAVVIGLILALIIVSGIPLTASILLLPLWTAAFFVLTASVAMLVATLNILVRDTSAIVPGTISLLFWLTPVIWPLSQIAPEWRTFALLNPAAVIIEGYRSALLGSSTLAAGHIVLFVIMLGLIAGGAIRVFQRLRPTFADWL
jgi:lipopolysaccharide transport system permease protein